MSIRLEGLEKRFAAFAAVDDLDLEIADGELFVLLGPSGSGKSTVLRIIAGLLPPDGGTVWLHGRDVTHLPPQARNVGMVFQHYSLFGHMTVGRNIEFGLEVRRVPAERRRARRDELLDLVGMTGFSERYPRQLSGGQMQRVAVARALAFEPSVLLLDEPFGALDVRIRGQLRRALRRIQRHLGLTTVMVTHDQDEAFELGDRIGVIDQGRLLEVGRPEDLYRHPKTPFVAGFLGTAVMLNGRRHGADVRLGALELPWASLEPDAATDGQSAPVAVMLRPEDLAIAARRDALSMPVLGRAQVKAMEFRGALVRLDVELEQPPGVRSLDTDFGRATIPMEVAMLPSEVAGGGLEPGAAAWVGIRNYHVLSRTARSIQLCLHPTFDRAVLAGALRVLGGMENLDVHILSIDPDPAAAKRRLALARRLAPPGLTGDFDWLASDDWVAAAFDRVPYQACDLIATHTPAAASADRLARSAPLPVLLLKDGRGTIARALVCTAAGEPGKLDVLVAARVVRRLQSRATLLHVVRDGDGPSEIVARHLAQGAATLRAQGIDCDTLVRRGDVLDEILATAAEGDYDLIVVGGHLPGGRGVFAERDLAATVARRSDRSVLVVRGAVA